MTPPAKSPPQPKYIEGLGLRHARPRVNPNVVVAELQLSPEEFFFISRIDGHTTYGQLCSGSGMSEARAAELLSKLKARKIILGEGEPTPPKVAPRHHEPPAPPAAKADQGRRLNRDHTPTPVSPGPPRAKRGFAEPPTDASAPPDMDEGPKKPTEPSILERLDDHSSVDAMLVTEAPGLDETFKLRLLRVHRRLATLSPYDLLGVAPDADRRDLKRGYFNASKEFHPDRHYGKNIGPYRQFLTDIFNQTKTGFEALIAMDDKKRAEFNALLEKRAKAAAAARKPR